MGDWERDMEDGPVVGGLCLEQKYQTPTNDVITQAEFTLIVVATMWEVSHGVVTWGGGGVKYTSRLSAEQSQRRASIRDAVIHDRFHDIHEPETTFTKGVEVMRTCDNWFGMLFTFEKSTEKTFYRQSMHVPNVVTSMLITN